MAGSRPGAENGFEYWGGISGELNSGLVVVDRDAAGNIINNGAIARALRANFGIQGVHRTRHGQYGLAYIGTIAKSNYKYLTNSEHALAFDSSNRLTKRIQWDTETRAGTMVRPYGYLFGYASISNEEDIAGVIGQPVTNRFYFGQHQENFGYRLTSRTELIAGGNVFKVVRAAGLYSSFGFGGDAGITHALSSRTTIGAQYQYLNYQYGQNYGGSQISLVMGEFARRLSPRWHLDLSAGGMRTTLQGERVVTPDPIVALLFGNIRFIETFNTTRYTPAFKGTLSGRFPRWHLNLMATRQPTPGNGLIRTTINQYAGVSAAYSGVHHWTFSVRTGMQWFLALQDNLAQNRIFTSGASTGYYLGRNVSFHASADYRKYVIRSVGAYRNEGSRVMFGVTYHSREHPISLW